MELAEDLNTVVFPLRTSVELFTGADQPSAVARAKQAAVLYERVVFEEGLLDVSITTTGPQRSWTPRQQLTEEDLARSRQPIPAGTPVTFAFGKQPRRGVPARPEDMVAVESSMLVRYMAEFHSGILDELAPSQPEWLKTFVLPDYALDRETRRAVGALDFRLLGDRTFMTDAEEPLRDYVYKSFNHDAYIAGQRGAAINVTRLFAPMLGREAGLAGERALEVVMPNLEAAPWEAVLEFRAHAGSTEARGKLREYERQAAAQETGDSAYLWRRIAGDITSDLLKAAAEADRLTPRQALKEGGKTLIGLVPMAGQYLGASASVVDLANRLDRSRTSWRAALSTLRDASEHSG